MDQPLTYAARTDVGLVRESNQDRYGHYGEPPTFPMAFVLADGMGGHKNGQLAAEMAVDTLIGYLKTDLPKHNVPETIIAQLGEWIQRTNVKIHTASLEDEANEGMGTTLTMALFYEESLYVAHIGDSRCYLYRDNELEALTCDQNVAGELVSSGVISREEGQHHPYRNLLTQALGSSTYLTPEVLHVDRKPLDRVLLCSDGLHGSVDEATIAQTIRRAKTPQAACDALIDLALAAGAPDNVTAVVVFNSGAKV